MSEAQDQAPTRRGRSSDRTGGAIRWWQGPVLLPLGAALVALSAVGWLGYAQAGGEVGAFLARQGLTMPEEFVLPVGAGAGFLLVMAASFAMCGKLSTLLYVRRSLQRFAKGERAEDVLRVAPRTAVAEAWNRLLAHSVDQAEQSQAEALLRRNDATVDAASERAADGLWHGVLVLDGQQIIRYANGAAAVFLRQRREALPGIDVRRVVDDAAVLEAIVATAHSGSRQRRVFDVGDATSDESSVLRFSVRGIGQASEGSVLLVIEDVTQQRIADSVQHAFVAQATHELRTPLTNMRLYLEQLLEDGLTAAERGTALNVINHEVSRLDKIVGDMLSIAEIQAGGLSVKRGEVRLEPIFDQLQADYAESAKAKRIELAFDLPPKYPFIQGDRDKISIVLHNLMGNAIKYTPEGGSVRVAVREEGDRLVTEVTDTGIGISEEDAGRIFERFARGTDPRALSQTGTGLGLALARDIARLHEGDILLHSEPGTGSTFSFWLPLGGQATARAA